VKIKRSIPCSDKARTFQETMFICEGRPN